MAPRGNFGDPLFSIRVRDSFGGEATVAIHAKVVPAWWIRSSSSETILAWPRKLIAKKFDGSKERPVQGRTSAELITYYVLAFIRMGSRSVCIAGMPPSPDMASMKQMAKNMTLANIGFLCGCKYLLRDRD